MEDFGTRWRDQGRGQPRLDHSGGRGRLAISKRRRVRRRPFPGRCAGRDQPDRCAAQGPLRRRSSRISKPPSAAVPSWMPRMSRSKFATARRPCAAGSTHGPKRKQAERTAWAAPGVTQVDNLIAVRDLTASVAIRRRLNPQARRARCVHVSRTHLHLTRLCWNLSINRFSKPSPLDELLAIIGRVRPMDLECGDCAGPRPGARIIPSFPARQTSGTT